MQYLIAFGRPFVEIVLHTRGPQQLPRSELLLGLVLAVYASLAVAAMLIVGQGLDEAVRRIVVNTLIECGFYGMLLALFRAPERLTQTLCALFGADAVLYLVGMPLLLLVTAEPSLDLLLFGLLLWSLAVKGHILRNALGWSYAAGVVVAMGLTLALEWVEPSVLSQ